MFLIARVDESQIYRESWLPWVVSTEENEKLRNRYGDSDSASVAELSPVWLSQITRIFTSEAPP